MKRMLQIMILAAIGWQAGCAAGVPQVSGDTSSSDNVSGGNESFDIPNLSQNFQSLEGSAASSAQSENFIAYSSSSFVYGGLSSGTIYQMVSPQLSLGQKKLGE